MASVPLSRTRWFTAEARDATGAVIPSALFTTWAVAGSAATLANTTTWGPQATLRGVDRE